MPAGGAAARARRARARGRSAVAAVADGPPSRSRLAGASVVGQLLELHDAVVCMRPIKQFIVHDRRR